MNQALQPRENGKSRRKFVTFLGTLAFVYPVFQFVAFKIPKKPTFVRIDRPVSGTGFLITADFILFDRDNRCWALTRTCTHLGCKLNYLEEKNIIECPCHQSQFHAETGKVLRGPAKRPLAFLAVEKRHDNPLYVVTT